MTPRKIAQFAIGPVGGALFGIIILPLIAWFFSQEDIGRLAMLQVTLSFSTLLFSLGLDQAYVREFHDADNQSALLKEVLFPGLALLTITISSFLFSNNLLSQLLFGISSFPLSLLIALVLISGFVSRFLSLILRMHERGLAFSMSQILPKAAMLGIIGIYILMETEKNLTNLILAQTASVTAVCVIFIWNTRREWLACLKESLDRKRLQSMLRFGLPLIFGGLAFWGLTATDKVFLRAMAGYEELGLYSMAVRFAAAATVLQSVFTIVWAPTVYKWASQGEGLENVYRVTRYVLLCVIALFCLAGLFSWIITFILPSNYSAVQWLLISCLAHPLLYTLSETTKVGIGISRRSSFAMLAAILAFVVNAAGNWILIPHYGAGGAAVSSCIAFFVFFVLRTEFSIYLWRSLPRILLYSYTIALTIGAVISTMYGQAFSWLLYTYWITVLLSAALVFRQELGEAMLHLKNWRAATTHRQPDKTESPTPRSYR